MDGSRTGKDLTAVPVPVLLGDERTVQWLRPGEGFFLLKYIHASAYDVEVWNYDAVVAVGKPLT
jgi:hypothetical protein